MPFSGYYSRPLQPRSARWQVRPGQPNPPIPFAKCCYSASGMEQGKPIYPELQMSPTEPQTPKTEQLRRGLIQRAARLLRRTEGFTQDALAQLSSGCTPAKRRFLIKEMLEMQRSRRQLKRNIKRWSG